MSSDAPGAGQMSIDAALANVKHMQRTRLASHAVVDMTGLQLQECIFDVEALPLYMGDGRFAVGGVRHLFDIITDWEGEIPKQELVAAAETGYLSNAPLPFGNQSNFDEYYSVSVYLIQQASGEFTILKHFEFERKVKRPLVTAICNGLAYGICWQKLGENVRDKIIVLQVLLESCGGFQLRSHTLEAAAGKGSRSMALDEQSIRD